MVMKGALRWFQPTSSSGDSGLAKEHSTSNSHQANATSSCGPATGGSNVARDSATTKELLSAGCSNNLSPPTTSPSSPSAGGPGQASATGGKSIEIPTPPRNSFSQSPSGRDPSRAAPVPVIQEDVEMTCDAGVDQGPHDSFTSAGPKPISVNPNRNHGSLPRRESLGGSLAGGISWGGISLGSFIRDDILMTGTSPYPNHQSPSYHSSSYVPKWEANFMRDFTCCNKALPSMHDLITHYEENHTRSNSSTLGINGQNSRASHHRPTHPLAHAISLPGQHVRPQTDLAPDSRSSTLHPSLNESIRKQLSAHLTDDMDALGDMEMDDALGTMDIDDPPSSTMQPTHQLFGAQRPSQLHLNTTGFSHQGLRASQPPTPAAAAGFGFHDVTVSSVNTPTLSTRQQLPQQASTMVHGSGTHEPPTTPLTPNYNDGSQSVFNLEGALGGMDTTIDDPAKRLFSLGGASGNNKTSALTKHRLFEQKLAELARTDPSQLPPGTDPVLLVQQMTALLMQEEIKPFKCPVIGCEKAYKNQNGLKYHKQHGHSSQQLHENADGTFSIVDPETMAPYPGSLGMEKEKPFKCETCGKRYKNLNGLKYHKAHNPLCDPEKRLEQQQNALATITAMGNTNGMNLTIDSLHQLNMVDEMML